MSAAGGTPSVALTNVSHATLSPDGKTLVFLREEGGYGGFFRSLWISSPPGRQAAALLRAAARRPRISRRPAALRARRLEARASGLSSAADASPRAADTEFWLLPFPAGTPRRVGSALGALQDPYPFSWMPDSRAHRASEPTGAPRRRACTSIGRTPRPGRSSRSPRRTAARPTPRCRRTAGRSRTPSLEEEYHLIEIPLDGSRYTSVLAGSRMETDPAWSPLGNQYAYVSGRTGRPEIWLRSRDGSFEKPLVTSATFKDGADLHAGRARLLARRPAARVPEPRTQRLLDLGLDDRRRAAGAAPRWPGTTYVDFPTWSPDGEWVAFTYMLQGKWGLAKVRAGGGDEPIVVKENIVYPSSPRWSPRGDWITCDTPEGFALVSPDGQKTRRAQRGDVARARLVDRRHDRLRDPPDRRPPLPAHEPRRRRAAGSAWSRTTSGRRRRPARRCAASASAPDGKSFLTSIVRLRGDVWLLEGFAAAQPAGCSAPGSGRRAERHRRAQPVFVDPGP